MRLPGTASLVVIGWVPSRNRQPCENVEAKKLTCEVERYTMHKHFYGNCRAKFQKNAQRKKTGLYADVLARIWSG